MLIGSGRYLEAFERDVSGRLNAGLTIQGEIKTNWRNRGEDVWDRDGANILIKLLSALQITPTVHVPSVKMGCLISVLLQP